MNIRLDGSLNTGLTLFLDNVPVAKGRQIIPMIERAWVIVRSNNQSTITDWEGRNITYDMENHSLTDVDTKKKYNLRVIPKLWL